MIQVEVFVNEKEGRKVYSVSWAAVVGVLCVVETRYEKQYDGEFPQPGATHEEMIEGDWYSDHPPNWLPEVWPVLAGSHIDDEYPLRVWHERHCAFNLLSHTIVPCDWPPAEDRENAVRIGKELIKRKGSRYNWVDLTDEDLAEEAP
jgi:hypothetical protein